MNSWYAFLISVFDDPGSKEIPKFEFLDLALGERSPLEQQGREKARVLREHHDVLSGFFDPPAAQGPHRGGERAEHLPGRKVLEPHHVQHAVFRQAVQIQVEGLRGVEIVLREHVGRSRGAAVRVDARELDDVEGLGRGGQEVPALRVHEGHPWIVDPVMEVVPVDLLEDMKSRGVDLDPGDPRRVEAQPGQDVEASAHADDRDLRFRHQGGVVPRRVDRLLDADQGFRSPVIVDRAGESEVVLGDQLPVTAQEGGVLAEQRRVDSPGGRAARDRGDLDARHRVPFRVLEHGLRARIAGGGEHGAVGVVDGEDLVPLVQADRKQSAGEDAEQPQGGTRGAQEGQRACHQEKGETHDHGLDVEVAEQGQNDQRAQGRTHEVEEVHPPGRQALVRKERAQHDSGEGKGHGEEERVGRPLEERFHQGQPGLHGLGLRPRRGEEGGRDHGRESEEAGAHEEGLLHALAGELRKGGQQDTRDREPEHGQGNDQEGVVVEELRGDDPIDQDLQREGRRRGQEREGARLFRGETAGGILPGLDDRMLHKALGEGSATAPSREGLLRWS
jgi:hypothetical protein